MAYYEDRQRAESFGQAASNYDEFRPQYPESLVQRVVDAASDGLCHVLDVGSGTGILAMQLRELGCEVLAVEPDSDMAAIAEGKGLRVDVSSFESWEPRDQTFDIITFGQSFHWVDPALALPKIERMLKPGGSLALAWNDVQATGSLGRTLASIEAQFNLAPSPSSDERVGEHPVLGVLKTNGFDAEETSFEELSHYSRDAWLSMIFTHSAQLTMEPHGRDQLYAQMYDSIPGHGLTARNTARLILARPSY